MKDNYGQLKNRPSKEYIKLRQDKQYSIIGFREKESKYYFHCSSPQHKGVHLVRVKDGWICPEGCGYTSPAIRTVLTLNNPSSLKQ
jgi:hypothetical protein